MRLNRRTRAAMREEPLVYIVDDDKEVRDAIALLLHTVGLNSRPFGSAGDFLDDYHPEQHGCLVTDIRMPGMSGLDLQKELNRRGAPIPMIIITGYADVPMVVEAMEWGALDFIEKPFNDEDLLNQVHHALAWDKDRRAENLAKLEIRTRLATLTPRETQVMEGVVQGKSNKAMSADLGISQRTTEIHRARVMHKMGVRSIAALVHAVNIAKH